MRASLALVPLLLASTAHAQLFNQILPAEIYGTADQPDVTVVSRLRTGYDNGGVRVGDFIIRPGLTESAGYETNVLGTSRPSGDAFVETSAIVAVASENTDRNISATVNVDDQRFARFTNQSFTTYGARIGANYSLGHDTATITISHDNQVQTPRDLDVPQLTAPLAIAVDRIRLGYRAVLNRLSLTPDINVERYVFNSGQANGILYDQSFRNRIVAAPGVTAAYEFATRRSIVLVLRDTLASYSRGTPANPKRDFNDAEILTGLDYDLNGFLRARLLVGYERRTFNSTSYATLAAPIAELSLIYNPTGLTTVTATLTRRIQDSSDETTAGVTSLSGRLRVDHELRRNVILGLSGSVVQYDYAAGGSNNLGQIQAGATSERLYQIGLSANYFINRYASAGATYDLTARTGSSTAINLGGAPSGGNFIDNRFTVQLKLAL